MPRQLPWISKSNTKNRASQKPARGSRADRDNDDQLSADTIFSRKGKERALSDDEDLPTLPGITSPRRSRGRSHPQDRSERAFSSSPPHQAEQQPLPRVEQMRKGISKHDLKDDGWMMVEDEFLQTAKLFTQHLHLAEYARLRKNIDEKRQETMQEEIARPVMAGAKPSFEGILKEKAAKLEKKQRAALQDVFKGAQDFLDSPPKWSNSAQASSASTGTSRAESIAPAKSSAKPSFMSLATRELHKITTGEQSDGDDLDVPPKLTYSKTFPSATSSEVFSKPALPSKVQASTSAMSKTRPSRRITFDDIFNDAPIKQPLPPVKQSQSSSSTTSRGPSQSSSTGKTTTLPRKSKFDSLDDSSPPKKEALIEEETERTTKRKAERGKEKEEERRKSVKLDDIPTFLF